MLDLQLFQDVIRAEFVGVVDRVDDDSLEGVASLLQFGTGVQQVVPGLDGDLVHIECVQPRLSGQKERAFGLSAKRGLADLRLPVHEDG